MNLQEKRESIVYWLILVSIVGVAIYFRLVGLGTWGFSSSDEYYIAKTGQNILKYGLPKFETGGYYTRGVLYEYFSVLLLYLGIKDVLAYRLVSVIFNLLSVPALFLLVKKISNSKIALFTITLFLFSALEIEFSRLARFYTAFQAFFLWYIYFLYIYIIENKKKSLKWMYLISVLSVFVYEGAIFIVVLNFLPFLYNYKKFKIKEYILPTIIFLVAFLFIKTDFRNMGVTNYLPLNISSNTVNNYSSTIYLPKILLTTINNNTLWLTPFVAVFGFSIFSLWNFFKENKNNIVLCLGVSLLIAQALLNQFGLVFYITIILLLTLQLNWKRFFLPKSKFVFFAIVLNLVFWLVYSFFTNEWFGFYPEVNSFSVKKVVWMFFNYPNIYEAFILPWIGPIPIQTVLTFLVIGSLSFYLILTNNLKENYKGHKFLLTIFLLMVIGLSIVVTPYNYARYSFFIYPLMLAFVPISIFYFGELLFKKKNIRIGLQIITIILFLSISEDFSFNHVINIDSKEINFKEGFNKKQSGFYYYREDYETVAKVINENRNENDIVISLQESIDYYLDKLDYMYKDYKDLEFKGRSRLEGAKEIWSNAKLIYREEDLKTMLENRTQTIWLVTFSDERYYVGELERELNKTYKRYLFSTNLNNTINVFRITKTK